MGQCDALTAENTVWKFCPNYPLSVAFVGVFLITLIIHIIQAITHRKGYSWVIILSALMQTACYVLRSMNIKKPSDTSLYTLWFMLLMVAPILTNAFVYMTLGRMVYNFTSKAKIFNIKAWRFGLYFVLLDILAFLIQMFGALMASKNNASQSQLMLGVHIYMGGIGVQQFFIFIFLALAIRFHWTVKRESNNSQALKLLYVQYVILLLITVRICFRMDGTADLLDEESTLVGLTFGGYLRSKITCMKCSGRSERCDRMMDLTVEIDGDIDTLGEALVQFTTYETLTGDNKYKCSRCKSYQKAKKKLTVFEAPNILTIVLKRFRSGNLGKLDKLVQFPEVLNLAPFMSGTNDRCPIYSLYGLVVHVDIMNAAYGGHYISYVKDLQGDWFRVDDSRVIPVDLETVLSEQAYILLYARHNPRVPSLARDSSAHADGKTMRNLETISSSNSGHRRNSKTKLPMDQSTDFTMHYQQSRRYPIWMTPNDFTGKHVFDTEGLRERNPFVDSSSDCSSILSTSDASSYSTDSTKDSSADDISGYMFGSSWYSS